MCPRYPHPPLSSNHPPFTTTGEGNNDVAHKEIPEKEGTRGRGQRGGESLEGGREREREREEEEEKQNI